MKVIWRGVTKHRALLVGILVILVAAWWVAGSRSFQQCICSRNQQTGDTAPQERFAYFPILFIYRDCIGRYIVQNNPAIVALATIIIAIFTTTLWATSKKQWEALTAQVNAAKESTDAAILSNQPHLSVGDWKLDITDPDAIVFVDFVIRNFGSTPAWIVDYHSKVVFRGDGGSELPPVPDYTSETSKLDEDAKGAVIPPKSSITRSRIIEGVVLGVDSFNKMRHGDGAIIVYGEITFEDFMGEPDAIGFSAQCRIAPMIRVGEAPRWIWSMDVGPPTYHYHRRKKRKNADLSKPE